MAVRRRKRKNDTVLIKFLIFSFITLFVGSIAFLAHYNVGNNNPSLADYDDVLLHLNRKYDTVKQNDSIIIHVKKDIKVNSVLSDIERILTEDDKHIKDYQIKKNAASITLNLEVEDDILPDNNINIVISKKLNSSLSKNKEPEITMPAKYKICIIIDDAGYVNSNTKKFIELPIKMGIAVLPYLKNSRSIAKAIHDSNKEVMLHMPLEPTDYQKRHIRLFKNTILCKMTKEQVQATMDEMLNSIQYAVGINNHQGSKATSNKYIMKAILEKTKMNNLFFIDSLTSDKSVTVKTAKALKVNFGKRDVFLDNKDDYSYIKNQMEQLIRIAQKKGKAIAIGHIGNINTYKVIRDYIPILKQKRIEFVNPSEIINKFNKEVIYNVTQDNYNFN